MKMKSLHKSPRRGGLCLVLLVLMALLAPARMLGQNTLTVYNGSATNYYVPIISAQCNKWQKAEYIIPASDLTAMNGKVIAKLRLYQNHNENYYGYLNWNSQFKVFLKEVSATTFGEPLSYQGLEGATIVYEGYLSPRDQVMDVFFDTYYNYQGGNLLVGFYTSETGSSDKSFGFYGQEVTGASIEGFDADPNSITATQRNFIPKTTFTYYDADACWAPRALVIDENSITATSVELDWTPRGDETAWGFKYTTDYGSTWTDFGVTANQHPYTLDVLNPATEYTIGVYAKCGDGNNSEVSDNYNDWVNSISTPFCNPEDECELYYELRSTNGDFGWGWSYISVNYKRGENDGVEVIELLLPNGTFQQGAFSVCDGATYDFKWVIGNEDILEDISFVITNAYGDPIQGLDYSNGNVPIGEWGDQIPLLENFVMNCPSCKKPRDFSVETTSTSASFTWTADSGYNSWELQYSTDEVNWSTSQNVTGNPTATIISLDPATEYFARVRANCGGGDYSPWAVVSFYTDCATLVVDENHPYSEDFDSYDPYDPYGWGGGEEKGLRMEVSDRLPLCWSSWNGSDYYEYSDYPYIFNDYCEMESNGLKFYVYNYEGEGSMMDQYAILPAMENIADLMMSFKAKDGESSTSEFSIGVMTDPADVTTFVEIQAFEVADEWNEFAVYFGNYLGQGEYIAIKVGTPDPNESDYLYIDDIVVSVLPTCFVPTGLTVNNISETAADVTWAPYGEETSWQVRYSTDKNNWTTVDYTEQTPGETITEQLIGLNANILYFIQLRANCGNEEYSAWSAVKSFRTECGQYQAVPYYEDFESYPIDQNVASCWSYINTCNEYTYPVVTNSGEGHTIYYENQPNTRSLYFYASRQTAFNTIECGILPRMQNINTLQMKFDAKGTSDDYWDSYTTAFQVGVMTDPEDASTFTVILDEQDNFHNELRSYTVSFADYQGTAGYIAIKTEKGSGNNIYLIIDNIAVEQVASMSITGYTNANNGWNLIASPMVGSLQPTSVENMISETEENYDLFAFDQSAEGSEWQNYKVHGFGLQNGQGYLYANSSDVTLGFGGALQPAASVVVDLDYVEGKPYAGWNLIGNPFNANATLTGVTDYYKINGNTLEATSDEIEPCEGVFVQATQANQSVTFTKVREGQQQEPSPILNIDLNNPRTGHRADRARLRFSEGDNLGKLNMLSDPNRIYFPMEGKDYAVVHVGTMGEMPLNFVAAENGRYSLSVSMEDVEMSYLHLVDNLTGADMDLLDTPVYSFEAKTTDYASRFKLVFAQGSSVDGDSFAFVRDGHLVVFGIEGQSTLQLVDMTGRVLSSEAFSGSYDKQLNYAPGVYMLRLVNGDHVKVQKIIIK